LSEPAVSADAPRLPTTQLELLAWDLEELDRVIESHQEALIVLADFTDVDRQRQRLVIADLFYRIVSLVHGLYAVLHEEIRTPAQVLSRALYEAIGTLGYLVNHPNYQHEALTWLAFSSLRLIQHFPTQRDFVDEHERLLEGMHPKAVADARKRIKRKPYTWSGKRFEKMASESGLKGYAIYALLSDDVHSGIVGEHMRILPAADARMVTLQAGQSLPESTKENSANFARRALHDSFKIFWGQIDGPPVELRSEDPRSWSPLKQASPS
jgi:hypothetical protein